ncbi:zinc ribbon domain-containing protein [Paenibacillus donghaensis]|uniref:Uncharacterized protein n=1 Tax=Paenibacillus donghaensis TaxID=414771 RepID=A0A2Z2KKD7_9BACL|nr:zinc ribbon domain-containing protein [Paenibacillus donghaensis]ASA23753.1 hypothetical protein B9T62_25020 [Paenibacillus donghaensis]
MNGLNLQGQPDAPEGNAAVYHMKYDRTAFDYITLVSGYLFMPFGLVLALIRLFSTHYKNYRKASNYNLLSHVFIGGFIQLAVFSYRDIQKGEYETAVLIMLLVMLALLFLLPAYGLGTVAARAKYKFSLLTTSYIGLVTDQQIRHIGTLSARTAQSESDVRRDVLYLKNKGLLPHDMVFSEQLQGAPYAAVPPTPSPSSGPSGFESAQRAHQTGAPSSSAVPPQLPKSVRCPGCGAQNTVYPGQAKNCDYCGTTIPYT